MLQIEDGTDVATSTSTKATKTSILLPSGSLRLPTALRLGVSRTLPTNTCLQDIYLELAFKNFVGELCVLMDIAGGVALNDLRRSFEQLRP